MRFKIGEIELNYIYNRELEVEEMAREMSKSLTETLNKYGCKLQIGLYREKNTRSEDLRGYASYIWFRVSKDFKDIEYNEGVLSDSVTILNNVGKYITVYDTDEVRNEIQEVFDFYTDVLNKVMRQ